MEPGSPGLRGADTAGGRQQQLLDGMSSEDAVIARNNTSIKDTHRMEGLMCNAPMGLRRQLGRLSALYDRDCALYN
jgi:hypothetical protein